MRKQLAPARRCRRIFPGGKHDVAPYGVGNRIYGSRRFGRLGIRVHTNVPKIVAKTRLNEGASVGVERLTSRA
jgi:hypothetical protein